MGHPRPRGSKLALKNMTRWPIIWEWGFVVWAYGLVKKPLRNDFPHSVTTTDSMPCGRDVGYKTVKLGDARQNTWSMMSNNDENTVAFRGLDADLRKLYFFESK